VKTSNRLFLSLGALCAIVLSATASFAQSFVELQVASSPKAAPLLVGYLAKNFEKSPFGLTATALVTNGWAEAYAGPSWMPTTWFALNTNVGMETSASGNLGRLALVPAIFNKDGAVALLLEANKGVLAGDRTAVGCELTAKAHVSETFSFGLKSRYGVGTGPLAEVRLGKTFSLWATWMPYRWEIASWTPANGIIGLHANM
jgi:hypothetical protein